MKRILLAIVLLGFIGLGVTNIASNKHKVQLKEIQLKDTGVQLKQVNDKYDELLQQKNVNEQELEKVRQEKGELEKQLHTKAEAKRIASEKAQKAAESLANVVTPKVSAQGSGGVVEAMVREAARKYGLDEERFVRIARCESGFNPNAVNKNYYAGGGNPSGVFQFIPSTWTRMSNQAGFGGQSVFDAYANVNTAAWGFANGRASEWECR